MKLKRRIEKKCKIKAKEAADMVELQVFNLLINSIKMNKLLNYKMNNKWIKYSKN